MTDDPTAPDPGTSRAMRRLLDEPGRLEALLAEPLQLPCPRLGASQRAVRIGRGLLVYGIVITAAFGSRVTDATESDSAPLDVPAAVPLGGGIPVPAPAIAGAGVPPAPLLVGRGAANTPTPRDARTATRNVPPRTAGRPPLPVRRRSAVRTPRPAAHSAGRGHHPDHGGADQQGNQGADAQA